jgi:hypothetical protein
VPIRYESPSAGAIRQGEILSDVAEHRDECPSSAPSENHDHSIQPIAHPLMIVLSQVCDLLRDWEKREGQSAPPSELSPAVLSHVLLCDLYDKDALRSAHDDLNRGRFERIEKNQVERFHYLAEAPIGDAGPALPGLYLDFKKVYGLPTSNLYAGIAGSGIGRVAVVPPIYLQQLVHRFFAFQSRVGVPE